MGSRWNAPSGQKRPCGESTITQARSLLQWSGLAGLGRHILPRSLRSLQLLRHVLHHHAQVLELLLLEELLDLREQLALFLLDVVLDLLLEHRALGVELRFPGR